MPIRELLDTEFEQECDKCGAVRTIAETEVEVGVERDGQIDTKVVPLPACPNCGSKEFLIRSSDDEPEHPSPGCFGHRHRLVVDVLHSKLVSQGKVKEGIDPDQARGRERTPEELEQWFKGRMRIRRKKEQRRPPEPEPIEPGGEQ